MRSSNHVFVDKELNDLRREFSPTLPLKPLNMDHNRFLEAINQEINNQFKGKSTVSSVSLLLMSLYRLLMIFRSL